MTIRATNKECKNTLNGPNAGLTFSPANRIIIKRGTTMTSKTIPAKTIVVCDRCGVETHQSLGKGRRRRKGVLSIESDGLDMLGDPCCNANRSIDLCDDCLSHMETVIDRELKKGCDKRPNGPICEHCGGKCAASGIDRGSWVHI
jgi:hypothetical protein